MKLLYLCSFLLLLIQGVYADNEMLKAARYFMHAFGDEAAQTTIFELNDPERTNWHYVPKTRPGASFETMNDAQDQLAHGLLASGLSREGYQKAVQIMFLEQILFGIENSDVRRAGDYHFSLFGEPSESGAWGWRVEGHHLSLNFTVVEGETVSFSPLFMGANPARVLSGPYKGMRVLAHEEDAARELLHSLPDKLREKAIVSDKTYGDVVTRAGQKVDLLANEGVSFAEMSADQQDAVMSLIHYYVKRLKPAVAETEMETIKSYSLSDLYFCWAGGTEPGDAHYYRIQGPSFMIEYDNSQGGANHVHTVWRDPANDFGRDVLAEHYSSSNDH